MEATTCLSNRENFIEEENGLLMGDQELCTLRKVDRTFKDRKEHIQRHRGIKEPGIRGRIGSLVGEKVLGILEDEVGQVTQRLCSML